MFLSRFSSFLVFGFVFYFFTSFQTTMATLTVEVSGIEVKKGKVYVAIFRESDDFPTVSGKFKGILIDATDETVKGVFSQIPPGTYAIACFHDVNNNGKMDKNVLGIPSEIYGFSNNARERFNAPSFKSASFGLKEARKMSIQLK